MQRYPELSSRSGSFNELSFEMARHSKTGKDVKTYLAADVDALVARLAAPKPVDPRWLDVEEGRRYIQATAVQRYPQLHPKHFADLAFEFARKPKVGKSQPADVRTYLAADVDALVARLAAPEPVDPLWLDVEAGRRYTAKTAIKRYPHLQWKQFEDLPFGIARRPKTTKGGCACDVKTYLAADVDALVTRLAAPEPVDPRWLEVEEGRRYTAKTAMERFPELKKHSFAELSFEMARRPKRSKCDSNLDVKTYLAADVDALAAEQAKKRPRHAPRKKRP